MIEFELDKDGYPSEKTLHAIEIWLDDYGSLMFFIQDYIELNYGWCSGDRPDGFDTGVWSVITGGWSGNESIINALKKNKLFWLNHWQQSTRGGSYIFDLN